MPDFKSDDSLKQDRQEETIDVAAEMVRLRDQVRKQHQQATTLDLSDLRRNLNRVRLQREVEERPFRSNIPVIGPIVAGFREAWNRIAAKWYVRHILQQQNLYNLTVYQTLDSITQKITQLARLSDVIDQVDALELRLMAIRRAMRTSADQSTGGEPATKQSQPSPLPAEPSELDRDYLNFNAAFSSASIVRETYQQYLSLFAGREKVLDVGCGQGHFLELLREVGVDGYGVDRETEMVEMCRLKGLNAVVGDAIAHLSSIAAESLDGIFCGHLIEHFTPVQLHKFLSSCYAALRPGGVLVCETPNTRSLFVLANTYFRDLTHQQPVHPETYQFMARSIGFIDVDLRYSALLPEDVMLGLIDVMDDLLVREINLRLEQINQQIFGYQNVALVAYKPVESN